MLRVIGCVYYQHDLRFVALAGTICALSSFATISLLQHARSNVSKTPWAWIAVASVAGASGIWATHFIAMLAFRSGLQTAYAIPATIESWLLAVAVAGLGLSACLQPARAHHFIGGALVGLGISGMHFLGMSAFEVQGIKTWDASLFIASIILGVVFGSLSLGLLIQKRAWLGKLFATILLTLAICSMHFTAMTALTIWPDPTVYVSPLAVPSGVMAASLAIAASAILLIAYSAAVLEVRGFKRMKAEGDRMRGLANAAVEGLVVCRHGLIVTANDSFCELSGISIETLSGGRFDQLFQVNEQMLLGGDALETVLVTGSQEEVPVEVIARPVDYAGERHVAIAVRDLRARRTAEQHIAYLAHHDPLTGLLNRRSFEERVDALLENAGVVTKFSVLCIDVDRFKEVNDLFGHAAGDRVLQAMAGILSGQIVDDEVVARLGGDEFCMVIRGGTEAASDVAQKINVAIASSITNLAECSAGVSIGIAQFPIDGRERSTLIKNADTALYRAKADGRGCCRIFDQALGREVQERRQLEHDLRHAIVAGQLMLVYQPQVRIATQEIIGFEALLRWLHPSRGYVSPSTFIPIAEETGAILQIGEWVLREACREAADWSRPLILAVNVSALQLHSSEFAPLVHRVLLETGLPASRLELEVTETALIRDLNRALASLRQLKALGVRIAMDDFGTGYSSLSNLRAFPFDKLKIDRSFVSSVDSNEQAAAIVRAVIGLGRGLGLPVLAEGVETNAEMLFLGAEACQEAQGYLIGRPSEIESFRDVIDSVNDVHTKFSGTKQAVS